jgi:hypothetical protein
MDRLNGHLKNLIMAIATRGMGLAAVYIATREGH